ncbi:MAG: 16S rRNA (uracil(1498)-N(3))-methyltransferase [Cyanobacteria bacterium J06623_4]
MSMVQRLTIDASQRQGETITLRHEQTHYLCRVLRLHPGDRFIAQDGQGQQWLAAIGPSLSQADIIETMATTLTPSTTPIRLLAALPKGNSFDQVVRQTTELGITHICPIISDRTLLKPSDNKRSRWRRIAQEASEQSERVIVPEISPPVDFQTALTLFDKQSLKYICAARQSAPHLLQKIQIDLISEDLRGINFMIGPEGGWTSAEITDATSAGYKVVSLGTVILRAVTAPVTALSLITAARELLI